MSEIPRGGVPERCRVAKRAKGGRRMATVYSEDLKSIAEMSTELKLILQQISRYSDLAERHHGERKYVDLFHERLELGLQIAHALLDQVNATLFTKSASVKRTEIAALTDITPVARRAKQTEVDSSRHALPADITAKNPKGDRELILLVEDEKEIAELAAEILSMEGYRVVVATNGVEALKIYARLGQQIALVILDFFMPIMDGDAVFEELQLLNPDIAVVLSSGFAEENKIGAMLADGLRGFIPKPYTSARLLTHVRSTLDVDRATAA